MKAITVLLADSNAIFRKALRAFLKTQPDFRVVGEARHGRQAVLLTRKLRPDIVLIDMAMVSFKSPSATRHIFQASPSSKLLILTVENDPAYIQHAAGLGAKGCLIKHTSSHRLPKAIRDIHKGHLVFPHIRAPRLP
jgi:DNA-binding NarL/FixJ family response regulator